MCRSRDGRSRRCHTRVATGTDTASMSLGVVREAKGGVVSMGTITRVIGRPATRVRALVVLAVVLVVVLGLRCVSRDGDGFITIISGVVKMGTVGGIGTRIISRIEIGIGMGMGRWMGRWMGKEIGML